MKKISITLGLFLSLFLGFNIGCSTCYADSSVLSNCYKIYPKDADSLFMSALSALNSDSRFDISEIQSKNGYILFLYGSKYYLLTLTKRYQNQTEIKILPQNSDFSQGSNVAQMIFLLIDSKIKNMPMELVK